MFWLLSLYLQLRVGYIAAGALTHKSLSITQAVRPSLISKTNGENASALLEAGALYLPPPSQGDGQRTSRQFTGLWRTGIRNLMKFI